MMAPYPTPTSLKKCIIVFHLFLKIENTWNQWFENRLDTWPYTSLHGILCFSHAMIWVVCDVLNKVLTLEIFSDRFQFRTQLFKICSNSKNAKFKIWICHQVFCVLNILKNICTFKFERFELVFDMFSIVVYNYFLHWLVSLHFILLGPPHGGDQRQLQECCRVSQENG